MGAGSVGHYEATESVSGASCLAMFKGNRKPLEGTQLEGDLIPSMLL